MTKDASSQACLISLTSLKEWREDSGIVNVGMMAPLSDQDYYSRGIITTARKSVSLRLRAQGNETACAGGGDVLRLSARIRLGAPPITAQWSMICACSYAPTLASARGSRPRSTAAARRTVEGRSRSVCSCML